MLRSIVFAIALAVLAIGALAVASGVVGLWVLAVWAAIVAAGIAFERYRYKPLIRGAPGPRWEKTNERFVDDESGKTITVYVDRQTGERQYVEE
jgi:hypothetical protein